MRNWSIYQVDLIHVSYENLDIILTSGHIGFEISIILLIIAPVFVIKNNKIFLGSKEKSLRYLKRHFLRHGARSKEVYLVS